MKKILMLTLASTVITSFGQVPVKEMGSKIDNVTVFRRGAQVHRVASTSIQPGKQTLVFNNLPQNLDPQSIQVEGKGNLTIMSVLHQINYLKSQEKRAEVIELERQLEILRQKQKSEQDILAVYTSEEGMLKANQSVGGSQTGVTAARLRETADFFRSRMLELQVKKQETGKKLQKINLEIQDIQNQLNSIGNRYRLPTSEVLVDVMCEAATRASLELSYLVTGAGWAPSYNARATDITQPVNISYNAQVYQTSGEDWDNVNITLSTGNPQLSGTKPILYPWYLRFYSPAPMASKSIQGRVASAAMQEMEAVPAKKSRMADLDDVITASSFTQVVEGQTNIEFEIGLKYTIPSDGKQRNVAIRDYELPADFNYYAVPKLEKDAFLLAGIIEWEELNLLPGNVNIFFGGKFIGRSFLDPTATGDTLLLSLGRDQGIVVKRTRQKDFSRKQLIGGKKTENRSWEIEVRNTKGTAIHLYLEDQVPLSTNQNIEVSYTELSGGKLESKTGMVTWEMDLDPGKTKKFILSYSVKYPKGQVVIIE
jgi:uncharacterized protein (TIGR02231 family)